VSAQGSNLTGTGSVVNPFQTIQYAITQAQLVASSANQAIINVSPGVYAENLSITNGYITLASQATNENMAGQVQITGTVSVAIIGSDDLFGKVLSFIGFTINGAITDTSTAQHTLGFQNCYLSAGTGGVRVLYVNPTSTDQRTYLQNCSVQTSAAAANAAIELTVGWLEIDKCDVTVLANIPCIKMSGSSRIQRASLCSFENSVAGNNTLAPLINFSTTGLFNSVGNNTFSFSAGTAQDPANPNICGILFDTGTPTPAAGTYNLLQAFNLFVLAGTTNPQHHAIAKTVVTTPVVISYSSGSFPGLAFRIEAGITNAPCNTVA
jgi:hypothetical protein